MITTTFSDKLVNVRDFREVSCPDRHVVIRRITLRTRLRKSIASSRLGTVHFRHSAHSIAGDELKEFLDVVVRVLGLPIKPEQK